MKEEFLNKLAEDVLSADGNPQFSNSKVDYDKYWESPKEEKKAKRIYNFLIRFIPTLDKKEKADLKADIISTITGYRKKKLITYWSSAAAILIIAIVSTTLIIQNNQTNIEHYASKHLFNKNKKTTRLILNGERELKIGAKTSTIDYAQNGSEIVINAQRIYSQEIKPDEQTYNTVIVPYGKRTQLSLADGTKVWLNSGSRLDYPASFSKDKREIYLEGEALFDVIHDEKKPFIVSSNIMEVKVLGTVFNMSVYEDDEFSSATLVEGSIELKYNVSKILPASKTKVEPGTIAIISKNNKSLIKKPVETKYHTSWKDGYLIFRQTKLKQILRKVSRYYNVEIDVQDPKICEETFSGYLDLKNNALQVLETINRTSNFKIEKTGDIIIIK